MQGLLLGSRYRLINSIGSGGMGRVWRARDEVLNRAVAIKELTASLYVNESDRAVLLARTHAEARAAARINHPAVVTVHDVLEYDDRPWIVMELVEGGSLADAVKERGRLGATDAGRIGLWVLRALRAAHSAGVLHRDVKPGNVMLATDGRVLITDFGIAQIEGDTGMTRTGEIVGSVDYLAPEVLSGEDPDFASDLWALGATLYTAVEGRSPFRRTTPLTTMQAVVTEEPLVPRFAGPLEPVITALLAKDPAQRPNSEELEEMLAEAAEGRRPKAAQAYVATLHVDLEGQTDTSDTNASGPDPEDQHAAIDLRTVALSSPSAGGHQPKATSSTAPKRRRRAVRLVLAVAAVAGTVGTAAVFANWQTDPRAVGTAESASPSDRKSTHVEARVRGGSSDDWELTWDPAGFALQLPDTSWHRQVFNASETDYTPDKGNHFIRIGIDRSQTFTDTYTHQADLEHKLRTLDNYKRIMLRRNTFHDRSGSRWEYTWTAMAKDIRFPGPRHTIKQTYVASNGVEYAISMSGPESDWKTVRQRFDHVLGAWGEPRSEASSE
ncbi:serine/threonine-protein kinase [Streptomyces sp. NPDC051362]|uniref:serine/threonine-protein kinase n=1 Tax=Streptomyces sp. NPDC051362 TaxID=3365651 RepID=UPI0037886FA9